MLDEPAVKALLLRIAARDDGSAEAFRRLYETSAPLLLGVAQRILARQELAEEVLHDTFASIWRSAGTFDPLAAAPVGWMVSIARNRAIDVRSRHDVARVDSYHAALDEDPEGSLDRLFDWSPAADESVDQRRAEQRLRECLARLAAVERQVLVLAYEHGLSHRELAAHFSKPLGTVKSWVRRGLASLRGCVEAGTAGEPR